ncbi:Uma2 family endonuclease [Leptolyngbya sp. PCC 6406]|uniref:Uma2 family endonuclease n=1 Tax=Leptolyngbya sp. PCC 6406 TaxID=1173264 RepID=UPI0002ACDF35|nr:Uma2 family endonuclease [Leptolyngbya sp. PCC 6406]
MIAQPQTSQHYSPSDYLDLEVASEMRHEYINGEIVPMTGGTPNHNRIIRNLCTALTLAVRGQAYEVFIADQRLWIPDAQIYTYPDVMVVAGELTYQPGRRDTLTNPLLIVEVLSPSTRSYDRGDKFAAYRTIPTLAEYLRVDQSSYQIEHYAKTGAKQWLLQVYDQPETTLQLTTLEVEIALTDIYDKVQFEAAPSEPPAQN